MNILIWVIFGGIAGWVASMIVGNDPSMGLVGNIIVGIIGAFVGGFLADKVGMGGAPGVERPTSIRSFITAVIGAIILLVVVNAIF
jgi:uncharacterized membrane protein YeaQ/YmgE (transglycosylase-associated protein family)